ncbi:hypothetical protein [Arthrobacter sp. SO3]|nr:hypothetical protein [Arthrobacter sp. SO3]
MGFVDSGDVRHELIPDGGELEVRDQADDLLAGREGFCAQHFRP